MRRSFQTGPFPSRGGRDNQIAIDDVDHFDKKPLMMLSVALCTFNGEQYLAEQLDSIERQTRLPDEIVVCDDRSEDGTVAVIGGFAARVGCRVSFCMNPKRLGATQNFARAVSLCRGDIIVPCDQDDLWEPDKLDVLEGIFRDNAELLLAFHDLAVITPEGKPTGRSQWARLQFGRPLQDSFNRGEAFELLLRFNVVTGAAMAFRSSLQRSALPIPEGFVHDEWIGLIAAATGKVQCIDRPLVRYRQHALQMIGPATPNLAGQYRHARANMNHSYFVRMVERTRRLHQRLLEHSDALLRPECLSLVEEKLSHAQIRLRMRDRALIRWPLAIGEAVRGRYGRFGYGFKSFLQDLVL
jgi:glycosyltransferase involved in cell wall biosynthesis